jgi:hypothetical protein
MRSRARNLVSLLAAVALAVAIAPARAATPGAGPAGPSAPRPPTKKELRPLFAPGPGEARASVRVSHVLGDLGGGRFPVLGYRTVARTAAEIAAEEEAWDHWSGPYPEADVAPFVGVVARAPEGGWTLAGRTDLPTAESPHADFGWGRAALGDHDGDGRPELFVVYGYRSRFPGSTFGEMALKENAWVAFPDGAGAPAVALHLTVRRVVGGLEQPDLDVTWRYAEGEGGRRDVVVTTREDGRPEATVTWHHDPAADRWVAPVAPAAPPAAPPKTP